jgi:hypothetical protein
MQPDEVAAPRVGQPKPDDLLGQSLVFTGHGNPSSTRRGGEERYGTPIVTSRFRRYHHGANPPASSSPESQAQTDTMISSYSMQHGTPPLPATPYRLLPPIARYRPLSPSPPARLPRRDPP